MVVFVDLTACSPKGSPPANVTAAASAPATPVDATHFNEEGFKALSDRVAQLETKETMRSILEGGDAIAYLTPDDKNWQQIKTSIGYVVLSLENVTEYANGSEVTLKFGNPSATTLGGLQAHIEWGPSSTPGQPPAPTHSKDVEFTDSLPPASWHNITVQLADVPPQQLGFVKVSNLTLKTISLRTSN